MGKKDACEVGLLVPVTLRVTKAGEVDGDLEREGLEEGVWVKVGDTHCVGEKVREAVKERDEEDERVRKRVLDGSEELDG